MPVRVPVPASVGSSAGLSAGAIVRPRRRRWAVRSGANERYREYAHRDCKGAGMSETVSESRKVFEVRLNEIGKLTRKIAQHHRLRPEELEDFCSYVAVKL